MPFPKILLGEYLEVKKILPRYASLINDFPVFLYGPLLYFAPPYSSVLVLEMEQSIFVVNPSPAFPNLKNEFHWFNKDPVSPPL